jgi:hypothetical protein
MNAHLQSRSACLKGATFGTAAKAPFASNASIAMRGMKHAQRDRAQQARRSRRRPPHRESLHGDKVREGSAALAGKQLRRF